MMSVILNRLVEVSPLTEDMYDVIFLVFALNVLRDGVTMGHNEYQWLFVATLLHISGDDAEVCMLFCSLFCDILLCYIV